MFNERILTLTFCFVVLIAAFCGFLWFLKFIGQMALIESVLVGAGTFIGIIIVCAFVAVCVRAFE